MSLGHHVHKHILKSIFVQAGDHALWVLGGKLSFCTWRSNSGDMFDTLSDFANLPLLVLVSTVLSFLLMPAMNAYSRFNERQADRLCLRIDPSVQPFISSMNKLAAQNLAERTPSKMGGMVVPLPSGDFAPGGGRRGVESAIGPGRPIGC